MSSALMMKGQVAPIGLSALPANRGISTRLCAVKQEARSTQSTGSSEEIYIGFVKGDYAPRAGRKGRVIKDDPKKYPDREDLGFFLGAVGGWAGGETGLWQLREEVLEQQKKAPSKAAPAPSSPVRAPVKTKYNVKTTSSAGKDAIYVGFSKEELELRKSGVQGRVIYDEAYKYPDREDLGPFLGVVGGFAGGEAVLKNFAETGELKLRKPGEPLVKKQWSPLTLAFLIIFAAAGGGVLLTSAFDLGDASVQEIVKAPIDDTTKTLLLLAVSLVGGAVIIGGIRAGVQAVSERVAQGAQVAQNAAINAAFFAAVFLAARAILESS